MCFDCPPGKFSSGGGTICTNCSRQGDPLRLSVRVHIVQPRLRRRETGMTSCKQCPTGKRTSTLYAAENCTDCPGGTFANVGSSACSDCPAGKRSPPFYESNGACTSAKLATTRTVRSNCTECDSGKFASALATANCTLCPAGRQVNSNRGACLSCRAGKYTSTARIDCQNCSFGHYSSVGASECTQCASGYAQHKEGQSSCYVCPAGRRSSTPFAARNCTWCADGKFTSAQGQSECTTCRAGTFMAKDRQSCTKCTALEPGLHRPASYVVQVLLKTYYRTMDDPDSDFYVTAHGSTTFPWKTQFSISTRLIPTKLA